MNRTPPFASATCTLISSTPNQITRVRSSRGTAQHAAHGKDEKRPFCRLSTGFALQTEQEVPGHCPHTQPTGTVNNSEGKQEKNGETERKKKRTRSVLTGATFIFMRILATNFAIVVFPVPGAPLNTYTFTNDTMTPAPARVVVVPYEVLPCQSKEAHFHPKSHLIISNENTLRK